MFVKHFLTCLNKFHGQHLCKEFVGLRQLHLWDLEAGSVPNGRGILGLDDFDDFNDFDDFDARGILIATLVMF